MNLFYYDPVDLLLNFSGATIIKMLIDLIDECL